MEIRLVTGWKSLKMAGHLKVSTIAHSESVFLGHNVFLNELELDSFFFGPKCECFGHQHYILPGLFYLLKLNFRTQPVPD